MKSIISKLCNLISERFARNLGSIVSAVVRNLLDRAILERRPKPIVLYIRHGGVLFSIVNPILTGITTFVLAVVMVNDTLPLSAIKLLRECKIEKTNAVIVEGAITKVRSYSKFLSFRGYGGGEIAL